MWSPEFVLRVILIMGVALSEHYACHYVVHAFHWFEDKFREYVIGKDVGMREEEEL